ncbi:PREDICTED: uncharacterized protein LOC108560550 [Nicrophorus vespilloides]|uniref:Uncharacterized protein LOC108560550 n=1 Tax=Nicrophorus vespilloides TaxID=110193 RepID=A0ABM1MGE1_NICVS|nr:PREDICTED: uncharacterized protein LOC108560550 [Nicrophorus vespilloides]
MSEVEDCLNLLCIANLNDVSYAESLMLTIKEQLYDEKSAKPVIIYLNKYISNALTRDKGFHILSQIITDISDKILRENCVTWTSYAVSHHQHDPLHGKKLQFLTQLIGYCYKNEDYRKIMVSNLLPKIVEACVSVNIKTHDALHAIGCLKSCLIHFQSACIAYKKKIEQYLLEFLDASVSVSIVEEAAKCFHYLDQVGGAGPSGSVHIKNFSDNVEKLYNTLNSVYDVIFEDIVEFQDYHTTDNSNIFEFRQPASNLDYLNLYRIYSRRLRNVIQYLTAKFECNFTERKTFNPQILLSIIERGLAVHIHYNKTEVESNLFSTIIIQHQVDLLHLLNTMINCLKYNFIRFSTIKMLQECLLKTKSCNCFKRNSEYKLSIYEVLKFWIRNSGEQIDLQSYEKILKSIIADITPNKSVLVLSFSNMDSKSKKAKSKAIQDKIINSTEIGKKSSTVSEQKYLESVCFQALNTLELLLKKVTLNVNASTCSLLFETIVKSLLDISVQIYDPPYNDIRCRLQLYKVLIAIFDQTKFSFDIGFAINLLYLGERSEDTDISDVCSEGLAALEKICQPVNGSLYMTSLSESKESAKPNTIQVDDDKEMDVEETIIIKDIINPDEQIEIIEDNNEDETIEEGSNYCKIDTKQIFDVTNSFMQNDTEAEFRVEVASSPSASEKSSDVTILVDEINTDEQMSKKCEKVKILSDIIICDDDTHVPAKKIKLVEEETKPTKNGHEDNTSECKKEDETSSEVLNDDIKNMLSTFVDEVN